MLFASLVTAMDKTLREANRLYQIGLYEEAKNTALRYHNYFPKSVDAMLLLAMTTFNQKDYLESKEWLRKISLLDPNNIIAANYTKLIKEIEHRYAPLSIEPDIRRINQEFQTAEDYRRGWLGPNFPIFSKERMDEPIAPTATPIPHPVEPSITMNNTVAEIAKQALEEKNYTKAYLFYSQLVEANQSRRTYLVGKAEAAYYLEKHEEVIELLGPFLASKTPIGFLPSELIKAKQLLRMSREKLF